MNNTKQNELDAQIAHLRDQYETTYRADQRREAIETIKAACAALRAAVRDTENAGYNTEVVYALGDALHNAENALDAAGTRQG